MIMNIDTCTMLIQYQYYVDTIWYWYSFNTMHGLYDTDGRAGTTGRRSPHRWPLMRSWTSSLSVISRRGRRRRVTPITWWGSSSTTGGASGVVTTPLAAGTPRLVSQNIKQTVCLLWIRLFFLKCHWIHHFIPESSHTQTIHLYIRTG